MNKTLHVQVHSLKFLKGVDDAKNQAGTHVCLGQLDGAEANDPMCV